MWLQTRDAHGKRIVLEALIDTGASDNFISLDLAKQLHLTIKTGGNAQYEFVDASGDPLTSLGTVEIEYKAGQHKWTPEERHAKTFYVLEGCHDDLVIGRPTIKALHALTVDPVFRNKPRGREVTTPRPSRAFFRMTERVKAHPRPPPPRQ